MSALKGMSKLSLAQSTQYTNPMAAKANTRQVYGRKGRRKLDPLKRPQRRRSPSPELCSAHHLPNPRQTIWSPPPPVSDEEIAARKTKLMVDILLKGGEGYRDEVLEALGRNEAPPPPAPEEQECAPAPGPAPAAVPDFRYVEPAGTTRVGRLLCDADFTLEQLHRTAAQMYASRENMPPHFAFCARKGSGAADDATYVDAVKEVAGELASLKVAEVADAVPAHPSLDHPIAGYQLIIIPCAAPPPPPPEADAPAPAADASVTDRSVADKT